MNTCLVVRARECSEEIETDDRYLEIFPNGILNAGLEILHNSAMTSMARRAIFEVGMAQGRTDFVLHDLHMDISMIDMKYKLESGEFSDIEDSVSEENVLYAKRALEEARSGMIGRDEYAWDALKLLYLNCIKKADPKNIMADSVFAICKLALKAGYRIIIDANDITSFGAGVFNSMFEIGSPEEEKSTSMSSLGISFKVILNDAQSDLRLEEPISNRIRILFPEASTVTLKVAMRMNNNE